MAMSLTCSMSVNGWYSVCYNNIQSVVMVENLTGSVSVNGCYSVCYNNIQSVITDCHGPESGLMSVSDWMIVSLL